MLGERAEKAINGRAARMVGVGPPRVQDREALLLLPNWPRMVRPPVGCGQAPDAQLALRGLPEMAHLLSGSVRDVDDGCVAPIDREAACD